MAVTPAAAARPALSGTSEVELPEMAAGPAAEVGPFQPSSEAAPPGGAASPTARVARGALALLSTQPITWTVSLLTAALLPRYLGDQALGQYAAALTISGLVAPVVALGVPVYLLRRIATRQDGAGREVSGALVFLLGVASLVALVLSFALPRLGLPLSDATPLRIALAGMVIATVQGVLSQSLAGQERFLRFAWLNSAGVAVAAGAGLLILVAGGGLTGYMVAGVVIAVVMFAVTWFTSGFRFHPGAIDPGLWRHLVIGGLPFLGWEVARYVYGEVGKLLLVVLSSEAVVGWYAAALRITSIPVFIPVTLATPLYAVLSRHGAERPVFSAVLQRSLSLILLLTVPISAMIAALAPAVPEVLGWPAPFGNSVPVMTILAVLLPIVGVDMALASTLAALDRQRQWLYVAIVAAVFSPIANAAMIPLTERLIGNGAVGAAICAVATELVMFVGALVLMPRGILDRGTAWSGLRVLLAGLLMGLVAAALRDASLPLAVAAGGLVYAGAALGLRVLRPADVSALGRLGLGYLRRGR